MKHTYHKRFQPFLSSFLLICLSGCLHAGATQDIERFFSDRFITIIKQATEEQSVAIKATPAASGVPFRAQLERVKIPQVGRITYPTVAKTYTMKPEAGPNGKMHIPRNMLLSALSSDADGLIEIIFPKGDYFLQGEYDIPRNVIMRGSGKTIIRYEKLNAASNRLFSINNSGVSAYFTGLHFRNIRSYPIYIDSAKEAFIEDCIFYGKSRLSVKRIDGLIIEDCEFIEPQGDECIAFIAPKRERTRNVVIRNCQFKSFSNEAIDLNSNCENFIITGSRFLPKRKAAVHHREELLDIGGGMLRCHNILIYDNVFDGSAECLAVLFIKQGTTRVLVLDNEFLNGSSFTPKDVKLEGGGDDGAYGVGDIRVGSCTDISILGNTFKNPSNRRGHAALVLTGGEGNPYGGKAFPQMENITFANNYVQGMKFLAYSPGGDTRPRAANATIDISNNTFIPRDKITKTPIIQVELHPASKYREPLVEDRNFIVQQKN